MSNSTDFEIQWKPVIRTSLGVEKKSSYNRYVLINSVIRTCSYNRYKKSDMSVIRTYFVLFIGYKIGP